MATFEGHTVRKENYEMPQILLLVLETLNRTQETFLSLPVITKDALQTGS